MRVIRRLQWAKPIHSRSANRLGFDDIQLDDEGRTLYGVTDDYEIYLGEKGYLGKQFGHGIANNGYDATSWHLPEEAHATNWATEAMCRYIRRPRPDASRVLVSGISPPPSSPGSAGSVPSVLRGSGDGYAGLRRLG